MLSIIGSYQRKTKKETSMSLTSNHIASDVEQFITIMNKANAEGFNKRVLLSDAPKGLLVFCGAVCEKTHIDRVIYRDTHKELDLSASTLNTLVDILPDNFQISFTR